MFGMRSLFTVASGLTKYFSSEGLRLVLVYSVVEPVANSLYGYVITGLPVTTHALPYIPPNLV